ncbi:DUF7620 family protein [Streptomyces sp. H27-D2]|uniref:DUF7620 family protein n=1 Tax=Streptomyces sp. H27-D2 TaxID=3046304 RepID=UPI003FA76A15
MPIWIKRLLRKHVRPPRGRSPGQQAASSALVRAEAAQVAAELRGPEVTAAAQQIRVARERNHFAELFQTLLEGRGR